MAHITLYDIDSQLPGRAWSPNVWKTRYCLNYKGIPYETEWVECPDIHKVCKRIGAEPTEQRADGTWKYTVPAIHDPSTGQSIADSIKIAEYLDSQYPNTPKLFPRGSKALQTAYLAAYQAAFPAIWRFALPSTAKILNPISADIFYRKKFKESGIPQYLSEEERRSQRDRMKSEFGKLDKWLRERGVNGAFLLGDEPGFADLVSGAYILWLKLTLGESSDEWKDISTWHNGRWGKLAEKLEKYQAID